MAPRTRKSTSKKRSRDSELVLLERISASLDTYMAGLPTTSSANPNDDDPHPPSPSAAPAPASASTSTSSPSVLTRRSAGRTSGRTMATDDDRGTEDDGHDDDDAIDEHDHVDDGVVNVPPGGGGRESSSSATSSTDDGLPRPPPSSSSSSSSSGDDDVRCTLATGALVRSIVRACMREGIVGGRGARTENEGVERGMMMARGGNDDDDNDDDTSMIVDALVSEYRGRHPSLVGNMILDGMARHAKSRDDGLVAAFTTTPLPNVDDDDDGGGRGTSKFARIVAAVDSDMRAYEGRIKAIRTARSAGSSSSSSSPAASAPKSKRGRPSGKTKAAKKKKKKRKNDDESRLVKEIARRYVSARDAMHRLPNGHLETIVDEARRELGLEHVECSLNKIDRRVRWIFNKHRDREGAPDQRKRMVDEMYARYERMKSVVKGGRLRPGTLNSIIEGVWLEHGVPPDPTKLRAIRQMVQVRFLKEHPEFEPANPNRLKIGELSEVDKRRRQVLLNEITARYVRTKAAHGKKGKMADGTIPKIIEDCKNDLGIHDFDVPPSSIRGRVHRKSLQVQKLGGDSRRYDDAIDAPLVGTINGWSGEGISVTRDQGLDLAKQILRGKNMDKDDDGNDVVLDAQWWTRFLHRNKKKLVCEGGQS